MTTLTLTTDIDAAELRARVSGDVVLPGDPSWDEARLAWNLAVDQRPGVVVFAESAEDVAAVVTFAKLRGYRVAPQGTGHNAAALGMLDAETILLKTERMRRVEVDPAAARVRADAGVIWQEVVDAAAEHGLAALHGSAHDVGVVGYSLGGGIGWYARRYGMAANSVARRRAGHGRRPDRARRRRPRAGALLGRARRRRQLRDRDRDRAGADPGHRGLRRRHVLADRARLRDPEGLPRLGRHAPGRGDDRRARDAVPAVPGRPGAAPRQRVRDRRGRRRSPTKPAAPSCSPR